MTTPDDKEHDKLLCERLATTVDHGICKCAERHRIAELEAELAAERGRWEEAEVALAAERARSEAFAKLLAGIHALLYPPPIKMGDGRAMLFRPQNLDPHAVLQELSDRIRALPDELADFGPKHHKD